MNPDVRRLLLARGWLHMALSETETLSYPEPSVRRAHLDEHLFEMVRRVDDMVAEIERAEMDAALAWVPKVKPTAERLEDEMTADEAILLEGGDPSP